MDQLDQLITQKEWAMDGKPALLLIHMQDGIIDNRPQVRESKTMLPNQKKLIAAFRERNLPIVFCNAIPNPLGELPAYGRLMKMIRETMTAPSLDELPRWTEKFTAVIPELGRRPDEPILRNWLLAAFTNSGLDQYLKLRNVKTVVLCGYATQSAVYSTAVQAGDLWYSTVIVRDASMTSAKHFWPDGSETMGDEIERVALGVMGAHIAQITSTDELIAHL